MRVIYKYPLQIGETRRHLPVGALFTHFGEQDGDLFAWFEVELIEGKTHIEPRVFEIYGTGREIAPHAKWLGTTQVVGYVWHLYEHEL